MELLPFLSDLNVYSLMRPTEPKLKRLTDMFDFCKKSFPKDCEKNKGVCGAVKSILETHFSFVAHLLDEESFIHMNELIVNIFRNVYIKDSSVRQYCTFVHGLLKEGKPRLYELSIKHCQIPTEVRVDLDYKQIDRRDSNCKDCIRVSGKHVYNIIQDYYKSTDPVNIAIYLLLVSGRRFIELTISNFVRNAGDGKNIVRFSHQAKCKTEEKRIQQWKIPLLDDWDRFDFMLKAFRTLQTRFQSNVEVTNKWNKNINDQLKYIFRNNDVTGHVCRKIYAQICCKLYNSKSKVADLTYISKILCHGDNSESTINYLNVKVV